MATSGEIELVLAHLQKSNPEKLFKIINDGNAGIGAVLKCLYESPNAVTVGHISERMHVSPARVTVLLQKMSVRGWITKQGNANDARVVIVALSQQGKEKINEIKHQLYREIDAVIDRIGMTQMMDFITISDEIKQALAESEREETQGGIVL